MKLRNMFAAAIVATTALLTAPFALATSPIALAGSIFPLTLISTPPINLTDGFNEMLILLNAQTVGISPTYTNAMTEPTGGVDTSQATFSTAIQGNPLMMMKYTDVLVSGVGGATTGLDSNTVATLIASATSRTIIPSGGLTVMVSGTAATATGIGLECSDGTLIASWPIADLVTLKPIGIGLYTSATAADGTITTGSALTKGCASGTALWLSNIGTTLATTSHVYVNLPYTAQ